MYIMQTLFSRDYSSPDPNPLVGVCACSVDTITPAAFAVATMPLKHCVSCNTELPRGKVLECADCVSAFYCSRQCQKDYHKAHRALCNVLCGWRLNNFNNIIMRGSPGILVLAHTDLPRPEPISFAHETASFQPMLANAHDWFGQPHKILITPE